MTSTGDPPSRRGLPADARFHHVGYACRDIAVEAAEFAVLGYAPVGDPFLDEHQGVRGLFLEGPGPRVELLSSLPGRTTLDPWLAGRARMYHLAYSVGEVEAALAAVTAAGGRTVSPPAPAVAFAGRPVCFAMLRNRLLVEFVASGAGGDGV